MRGNHGNVTRIFHTPRLVGCWPWRQSSVRSAMIIVRPRLGSQAPLGAACPGCKGVPGQMPILTELESK